MSDETRLWTELGSLGQDPLPGERSDSELIEAALAGLAKPAPGLAPSVPPSPKAVPRVAVVVGVSLALAAAVLLGWWLIPRTGLLDDREDSYEMAPAVLGEGASGGRAIERPARGSERQRDPRTAVAPGASSTEPEPPTEPELPEVGPEAAVQTGGETGGETGDPAVVAPRAARRSPGPHTAAALLERAQQLVATGDRSAAIDAYERLVDRFPDSAQAKAARVSLGRLELRRGAATRALAHFDAYLASTTGSLTEEARYGRIRALRSLGRQPQELASIDAFLAEHPGSLYAARLRKRAEELRR
ncbi:MAG: tetratricopeptide repeat protein [Nannocystaceae bacterium]